MACRKNPQHEPLRYMLDGKELWGVPCRVCKQRVYLAFFPRTPKTCERCQPISEANQNQAAREKGTRVASE